MKKFYLMAMFALVAFGGCSKVEEGNEAIDIENSTLSIGLPISVGRTAIDETGRASWVEGDTFALWAENQTGGFVMNGAEFKMMYYWHSLQSAVFTSETGALAEGRYTYYAVSPMPQSMKNRKVTYTLPMRQQGDVIDGAYDFMVATPTTNDALLGDKLNNLAIDFQHKTHLLKMVIPAGGNPLSEPIKQVVFTFPTTVAGDITLNATTPDAAADVSNGSKQLIVDIPNGFDEGEVAWARILEGTISGTVSYYAISTIGERTFTRTFEMSKECRGGHITPLSFVIPDPIPPTILRFKVGTNYLGESVEKITIYDHNGVLLNTFAANSSNAYDLVQYGLYEDGIFNTYAGRTFTVRFESSHAIVEQKVTIPSTINKYSVTSVPTVDVPYLFFEDFAGVEDFAKDDYDGGDLRSADGMLFSTAVSGWNGAHIKAVAGKCVRVNVRQESTGGATRSNGRLDTPAMKCLKNGASVKLKVEFDMGTYIRSGYSNNVVYCMAGTHTSPESSVLNGKVTTVAFSAPDNDTSRIPSEFEQHCFTSGHIAPQYGNDSFGSTFPTYSFTASGCNSATRLMWVPCTNQSTWVSITNGHYYLYIDNIRVSIAQ